MCEICANAVTTRLYGAPADGSLARIDRRLTRVLLPDLAGGAWEYSWAKGPVGSAWEGKDVLVCAGSYPIR